MLANRRKREYRLYTITRREGFTNYPIPRSMACWTYRVYATSIKQAYWLAAKELMATDAHSVGVRLIESDWRESDGVYTQEMAEAEGLRIVAPYLRRVRR